MDGILSLTLLQKLPGHVPVKRAHTAHSAYVLWLIPGFGDSTDVHVHS